LYLKAFLAYKSKLKSNYFLAGLTGQVVLNKNPNVWLDGAIGIVLLDQMELDVLIITSLIPPFFLGRVAKNTFANIKI
jgi:hypothetical protein